LYVNIKYKERTNNYNNNIIEYFTYDKGYI